MLFIGFHMHICPFITGVWLVGVSCCVLLIMRLLLVVWCVGVWFFDFVFGLVVVIVLMAGDLVLFGVVCLVWLVLLVGCVLWVVLL